MKKNKSLVLGNNNLVDYNFPLSSLPFNSTYIPPPNALSVIAKTSPEIFENISHHLLANEIAVEQNETIRSISGNHTDVICTWLGNRLTGEKRIRVATGGSIKERKFFSKGQGVALATVVEIG